MNLRNSIYFLCAFALFSCDKQRIFDEYKSVGNQWHKDSIVTFKLPEMDTINNYNLFVNIRNNNDYPFSNLFLIVALDLPNGMTKVDTLEYSMAKPDGTLLGEGFLDIKDNKLFYKENAVFKPAGEYSVSIGHAVRKNGKISGVDELPGITEVGFRIESTQ
ncbi:MAG: gliding motility lipoprotein GldH [Flavobacterium sp.]|nr:gliding motility lipoprotein GldH [Flavobacterium sp.]